MTEQATKDLLTDWSQSRGEVSGRCDESWDMFRYVDGKRETFRERCDEPATQSIPWIKGKRFCDSCALDIRCEEASYANFVDMAYGTDDY